MTVVVAQAPDADPGRGPCAAPSTPSGRVAIWDERPAWRNAAVATAVLTVVLGTFGSVGVLIDPLAGEFGRPRSQLLLLFCLALLVHSLTAFLAGAAADRWGPRPLLAAAGAGMAAGLLAPATAHRLWIAVVGYGLGLGVASACAWVATTVVVSACFDRRRSAALGVLVAGPAAGGALLAPVLAALIETRGPRFACAVLAAIGLVTCSAGAALTRRPSGRPIASPDPSRRRGDQPTGPALRRFYAAGLLMGLVAFLPLLHIVGDAVDLGLSPGQGAALLGLLSAMSATTRLGAGWFATARRLPMMYRFSHLLMAAGFVLWALAGTAATFPTLLAFALLFGAGYGAWLALGPAVLAVTCPPQRLGRALGGFASIVGLGGVVGPLLSAPLLGIAHPITPCAAAVIALGAALVLSPLRSCAGGADIRLTATGLRIGRGKAKQLATTPAGP